jgi:hypothetical protein
MIRQSDLQQGLNPDPYEDVIEAAVRKELTGEVDEIEYESYGRRDQEEYLDDISYFQVITKKVSDDPFKKVKYSSFLLE